MHPKSGLREQGTIRVNLLGVHSRLAAERDSESVPQVSTIPLLGWEGVLKGPEHVTGGEPAGGVCVVQLHAKGALNVINCSNLVAIAAQFDAFRRVLHHIRRIGQMARSAMSAFQPL